MSWPTLKLIQRSNFTSTKGEKPICLRYTQDRKVNLISFGISVKEKYWDIKKRRVKQGCPDSFNINILLDKYDNKSRKVLFDHQVKGKPITYSIFKRLFKEENYGNESFYLYVNSKIEELKGELARGTYKGYKDQLNKLKSFQEELQFNEISTSFIESYKRHLSQHREKRNNPNSISKSLSFIRSMLNRAKRDGLIDNHIFENEVKVGRIKGNREFLTLTELDALNDLYIGQTLKKNKQNVLCYFLFACYTGLRYSDIRDLKFENIHDSWVSIIMTKTKEPVRVPISEKAKCLIPRKGIENQKVFKVLTDQPTNRYLKEIMKSAVIHKNISFHCARHTFATCSMDLGIPIEVVSKVLGHTDIKTTSIYAKIRDGVKEKEMRKWG